VYVVSCNREKILQSQNPVNPDSDKKNQKTPALKKNNIGQSKYSKMLLPFENEYFGK
jgi:hypothetical protein